MINDLISREALKEALGKSTVTIIGYGKAVILDTAYDIIDNAPTVKAYTFEEVESIRNEALEFARNSYERPQGEYVDISKLRLMTVEECAGHTIDYAMGWKACVEWIKKGGAK